MSFSLRIRLYSYVIVIAVGLTACLKLDPSPLDTSLLLQLMPCKTFNAYTNTNTVYSYDTCGQQFRTYQTVDGTGAALVLSHVAKTIDGFVGVTSTSTNIYVSQDGEHWAVAGAFTGATPLVAACGNDVVIVSGVGSGSLYSYASSTGGAPFSSFTPPPPGTAYGNWVDLTCANGTFEVTGGALTNYFSRLLAVPGSWQVAAKGPASYLLGIGTNGLTSAGYFFSAASGANILSVSSDSGNNWGNATGQNLPTGATYDGAITYASGRFFVPYMASSTCRMRRFMDFLSYDDSIVLPACDATSTHFYRIKGLNGTVMAVGGMNSGPLMVMSTDGGATWSVPSISMAGITTIYELIAF